MTKEMKLITIFKKLNFVRGYREEREGDLLSRDAIRLHRSLRLPLAVRLAWSLLLLRPLKRQTVEGTDWSVCLQLLVKQMSQ